MQNKIHLQLQGNKNWKIFHQTSVKYDKMLSTYHNFMLGDTKPSQNLQSLQMLNFGIEEEALCLKDHKKQQIETVIGQVWNLSFSPMFPLLYLAAAFIEVELKIHFGRISVNAIH